MSGKFGIQIAVENLIDGKHFERQVFGMEAQKRGFEELTFTEHCPLLPGKSKTAFDKYVALALELIEEISLPRVKLGIELDYHPQLVADAAHLIQQYPFDYVLGTVHVHSDLVTSTERTFAASPMTKRSHLRWK